MTATGILLAVFNLVVGKIPHCLRDENNHCEWVEVRRGNTRETDFIGRG